MSKRVVQVMFFVVMVAFAFAKAAFADEPLPLIAYPVGTVITGDQVAAVGNIGFHVLDITPGIEGTVTAGAALFQTEGMANTAAVDFGAGLTFMRTATVGVALDTAEGRVGFMVLGDLAAAINAISGAGQPAAVSEAPRAETPELAALQARINRNPGRPL